MAALNPPAARPTAARFPALRMAPTGAILMRGISLTFLSVIVLLPIAALTSHAITGGWSQFWQALTYPPDLSAVELTVELSTAVVAINAVFGTVLAWVLVRDDFPGKWLVNAVVDLPFALPTIVAGVILLTLYGPNSPVHINVFGTRIAIGLGLLFVTLPFIARSVQPVLMAMDRDMEEAAAVLGARGWSIFFRIILPNLAPALLSGAGLAFARALGEFGSVVILSSNLPNQTQVISLVIVNDITEGLVDQAAALSVFLLALTLLVLIFFSWMSRRVARGLHE